MPRPLVVGNGQLLAALDRDLSIRDLYWPYVGLHNHLSGYAVRLGVWCAGRFAWLSDAAWQRSLAYAPNTLVTASRATHAELGLAIELHDCVLHRMDVLLRRVRVSSELAEPREVRIFLTHDFRIAETDIGDTVFYNPFQDALVHYKRDCYLLMAGQSESGGIYQYATGIKGFGGAEGTWRDAEDGSLSMNAIAQGSVDSTFSLRAIVTGEAPTELRAWICAAPDLAGAVALHTRVRGASFDPLWRDTERYWVAWCSNGSDRVAALPAPIAEVFRRSLLTIRSNIDNHGAIIAANDSDIMETARAHYSYMWPRDGAVIARTLDRLGYQDITRRFLLFCRDVLPADRAALMHKYSADGSWGATWHPWTVEGGQPEIPFQEDSTALVVWAIWKHFEHYRDLEFIEQVYDEFALPCADFLVQYRDPATGLPLPSYDLWEERRGVHAYTCGTVFGALMAAARLSEVFGDGHSERYFRAAAEVRDGIAAHLWDEAAGRFARRLVVQGTDASTYTRDLTVDSALYALWAFGAFDPVDPRIQATMRRIISRLWVQTDVGGLARYEGDYYFRRMDDMERVPGNPWIICTLWASQWYVAQARDVRELDTALELLMWAARHALPTGILPEQVHPQTGEPLSVAPLTWSHAEFVAATLDYLDRLDLLTAPARP